MYKQARTLVIINNAAARARRAWPHIRSALIANGIHFDEHETRYAGDATDETRAALRAGYRTIAVVGGDGTLSEAASGFFDFTTKRQSVALHLPVPINADAALAILPAGTGDDFARGLAGKREPVEEWTKRLIAHHQRGEAGMTHTVDVIYANMESGAREFICLNAATIGIGAEVAKRVAEQGRLLRRLPGEARFVSAALAALAVWRERRALISIDEGETFECASNLIAVANGLYAGGGMMFAPAARIDDGLLDIVMARDGLTRATILRELPRIRRGAHLANPKVHTLQATHVRIDPLTPQDTLPVEADGNVRGHTPAEFCIMHAALRIVL